MGFRRCSDAGLVGGEAFAVDAGPIKADANRQKGVQGSTGLPPDATSRAITEYLDGLDIATTPEYATSRRLRRERRDAVRPPEAHLAARRLRLCGPNRAKDEVLLAATAQTLRKSAKLIPMNEPAMATRGGWPLSISNAGLTVAECTPHRRRVFQRNRRKTDRETARSGQTLH